MKSGEPSSYWYSFRENGNARVSLSLSSQSSSIAKRRFPFMHFNSAATEKEVAEEEEAGTNKSEHRGVKEIFGDDDDDVNVGKAIVDRAEEEEEGNDDDGQSGRAKNDNSSLDSSVIS